jgi:hypothetical protein
MTDTARYVALFRMDSAGVDLARQRAAVTAFLGAPGRTLVGEFTASHGAAEDEAASASVALAIARCRRLGAMLLAALPETDFAVARDAAERAGIGVVLIEPGPPPPAAADIAGPDPSTEAPYLPLGRNRPPGPPLPGPLAPAGNRQKADAFARAILPVIQRIRASGTTSLTDIADTLNARRIRTAQGESWQPASVRLVLNRVPGDAGES